MLPTALKVLYYTLHFLMWLILGRVVLTLITGGKQNFMTELFLKGTEPVYRIGRMIFAFGAVPPEKAGTAWARIEGCLPFFLVTGIFILKKIIAYIFGVLTNSPAVQ